LKSLLDKHFTEIYQKRDVLQSLDQIEAVINKLQSSQKFCIANQISSSVPREPLLSFGRPPGRKECIILNDWLNGKLIDIEEDNDKLSKLKLVYDFCLLELIRESSVLCIDRGLLLKKLLVGLKEYYDKYNPNKIH